jgi:hypothetical protein
MYRYGLIALATGHGTGGKIVVQPPSFRSPGAAVAPVVVERSVGRSEAATVSWQPHYAGGAR